MYKNALYIRHCDYSNVQGLADAAVVLVPMWLWALEDPAGQTGVNRQIHYNLEK